ncbi:MAG: tape measure protein [Bacillota bacterium]|nr:tape measure protein [Bacillota bacterium]
MEQEFYRLNLVVEMHDRLKAALDPSRRRVKQMEDQLERTRKAAQMLDQQKIAPLLRVRDNLSASVVKADKLIKKLDLAQASPIIEAQDRVSKVVARVSAAIDALQKGKVDVVADMKGPLLDEITQARAALSALDGVKAGPVADLRGQLFSQLTHAMSQAKALDQYTAKPKATLVDHVTGAVQRITTSLQRLTGRVWQVTTGAARSLWRGITSPLGLLGLGAGGAGMAAGLVGLPLRIAGQMEQAQIGFTTMLKSAEKAKQFMADLVRFAVVTPFELPQLRDAANLLLAFQFRGEEIIPMLTSIGNAAAGLGRGAEGIQRIVIALGQIKAKSRVQAQELLQLHEAGVPALEYLAKALGTTTGRVMQLTERGLLPADKAIRIILAGMSRQFPNMMAVQSRSLLGLWSTIKDAFNLTILTRWGDGLSRAVKPRMERLVDLFTKNEEVAKRWGDTLERVAFDAGNAVMTWLERAFEAVNRRLRDPEFQRLDWSQKISLLLSKAASEAVPKAADLGMKLGANLAVGIGKGALKAAAEDPVTAGVLGLLIGSKVPGPIVVKLAVGLGIGTAPLVSKAGKTIGERIPGTEYFTEKRLAEERQAARWFKERASLASSMDVGMGLKVKEPLIKGTAIQAYRPTLWERLRRLITPHALGTIATSPHVAMVADDGPESIIPLSSRLRSRALALWRETGRRLGVQSFALGGFTAPLAVAGAGGGGGNVVIHLHMDGAVRASIETRADQAPETVARAAADIVARTLTRILQNTR